MTDCLLQGKRFFCREWAFSKVNHCLENRHSAKTCGALIMGGPGCGKTAVCCELVWPTSSEGKQTSLNGRLLGYHFCQAHDVRTLSVAGFINNLVTQLSKSNLVSEFKEKLENPSIRKYLDPVECERDPDEAFRKCILVPLLSIPAPENTLFIMVDSIDESFYQSGTQAAEGTGGSHSIAELLANHHHTFPHWLLLVCSSRKQSKAVTRMFTGFRKISLDDLRKSHVVKDVQQYILCRLDQEEMLRQHLSRETAEMLNQLHIKSNGCFLYLERVLDGVGEHFIILREIREIPGTLNGLFLWLCQRLFIRKQFLKIQPILNVILATQRPLTECELYECTKTKTSDLSREEFNKRVLLMSKILIDGCNGTKILFHHSFSEWLLDVKHCTQKYLCIASEGHGMLALRLALHADTLLSTAEQVHEFSHHLLRSGITPAVQNHHLVHLLLASGANVEESLCSVVPKDQKVVRLLLDAGAKMPTDEESTASSIHQMVMSETEPEDPIKNLSESTHSIEEVDANGRTLLLNAAYQGELQLSEALIAKSANIEAVDKSGQTALNLAARQGYTDVVSILLRAGACVNHSDNDGWTALRSASWGGHTEVVSSLLAAGAEVDHADSDQRTALRAAAWGGHDDIVLMLLTNGADVNKADNEGRTALIAAAYMGHTEIVEHLLDHKANINHEDCDGRTTLSVAALCIPASEGHVSVVSLLLERGAEVDHRDHDGMTPLLVAAYEGHKDVCELLLEWDADVDHCDVNHRSPLLAAASMGHAGVVSQLLIWGAAVDTIDSEGRTVLSIAAAQGSVGVVQLLLDRGLDEMHRDNSGWTPLHMAAYEGHKEVAKALLDAGARVNEVDNDGRHPLILAAQEGHASVVSVLLQYHACVDHRAHDGKTSLRVASLECHKEVTHLLLCHGADINYRDADGRSTLYVSALENRVPMATYLLDNGADVEAFDLEGRTALHVSSWQGHLEIVQLLVAHHANVNSMDNDQRTPIQSAAWQGHEKIVECFLQHGALVDHKCNQGATALCIAAQEGHEEVVRILLQYKANPNHADQFGRTAMRVAVKSGHTKVVRILEEFGASPSSASGSRKSVNSSSGSDTKPDTPKQSSKCSSNGVKVINSCEQKPINGNVIHSPPSDSPDSTMDRRKSYLSNNSSKSSSNLTSSNSSNNPAIFLAAQVQPGDLTFTQQLQQCSMPRNRIRPISRVLSPVSEPQTPVQSPPSSPLCETPAALSGSNIASVRNVPLTNKVPHDHNVNFLVPSPVKLTGSKTEKIAATINIYTNPNADLLTSNDEPVWQLNPQFVSSPNNMPPKIDLQRRVCPPDHAHPTIMGQAALELRSPEIRRKRNGIVTNPKFAKSVSVNGYHGTSPTGSPGLTNGNQSNGMTSSNSASSLKHKGPARPNGLPLKKETPL